MVSGTAGSSSSSQRRSSPPPRSTGPVLDSAASCGHRSAPVCSPAAGEPSGPRGDTDAAPLLSSELRRWKQSSRGSQGDGRVVLPRGGGGGTERVVPGGAAPAGALSC